MSEMRRCLVKASDMPEDLQQAVCDIAVAAFAKNSNESEVAKYIKKEMDQHYKKLWHCVVGKSFGSLVSHHPGTFCYFYVNNIAVLLFKSPPYQEDEEEGY
eukprot:UN01261